MKKIMVMSAVTLLVGCDSIFADQEKLKQLEAENIQLKKQVNELKFGAQVLLAKAETQFAEQQYVQAQATIKDLLARHAYAPQSKRAMQLNNQIVQQLKLIEQKKLAEKQLKAEQQRQVIANATANLSKENDEIQGITWYTHRNQPNFGKYAALYFGVHNDTNVIRPMRLKIEYAADDWLFVRSVNIKADDVVYNLNPDEFKRDNSGGSIWEWMDEPVTDVKMLEQILAAKRVVIRFNGVDYYDDFELPKSQQLQMQQVYTAWRSLSGKNKL